MQISKDFNPNQVSNISVGVTDPLKDLDNCFTILMPPPNRTGLLHIGHALNNTIQDYLIRSNKIGGNKVCWIPGTDHGGLATQAVVSRLHKNPSFETIKEFSETMQNNIKDQLIALGCFCDWSRESYTMDNSFSLLVNNTFIRLYNDGLIYRNLYPINWCTHCQTAISDEEVDHVENEGKMYEVSYTVVNWTSNTETYNTEQSNTEQSNTETLIVHTTRPETIFADVALAFHPNDLRYQKYIGMKVVVPFINREIPIITDERIDMNFGTGLMKVTPAHDKLDYRIGMDHNLPLLTVIDIYGKITGTGTKFDGKKCKEVRNEMDLKQNVYKNSLGVCYRCSTPIECITSKQWFIRMERLISESLPYFEQVEFVPSYTKKVLDEWLDKKIDWCISRQITWGHKIPVFYCDFCKGLYCQAEAPTCCDVCGSLKFKQDTDVLDTWFSSALWPIGNIPLSNLPSDILVTGKDILYFWVARMIMMSAYLTKCIPFKKVYLHGMVRDKKGRKMSKSLGNVINPMDVINKYGADSLRYALLDNCAIGLDLKLKDNCFQLGNLFCRKLWNSARFISLYYANSEIAHSEGLDEFDIWMENQIKICQNNICLLQKDMHFSAIVKEVYDLFWNKFCSFYLEVAKGSAYLPLGQRTTRLHKLCLFFHKILDLIHPIMPYITSYIKANILDKCNDHAYLIESFKNLGIQNNVHVNVYMHLLNDIRHEMNITPLQNMEIQINQQHLDFIQENGSLLKWMVKARDIEIQFAPLNRGLYDYTIVINI